MTTYHNPERQCWGKIRYDTKRAAKEFIKKREQVFGARLRAYHCPTCYKYHVGNPPPKITDNQGEES